MKGLSSMSTHAMNNKIDDSQHQNIYINFLFTSISYFIIFNILFLLLLLQIVRALGSISQSRNSCPSGSVLPSWKRWWLFLSGNHGLQKYCGRYNYLICFRQCFVPTRSAFLKIGMSKTDWSMVFRYLPAPKRRCGECRLSGVCMLIHTCLDRVG